MEYHHGLISQEYKRTLSQTKVEESVWADIIRDYKDIYLNGRLLFNYFSAEHQKLLGTQDIHESFTSQNRNYKILTDSLKQIITKQLLTQPQPPYSDTLVDKLMQLFHQESVGYIASNGVKHGLLLYSQTKNRTVTAEGLKQYHRYNLMPTGEIVVTSSCEIQQLKNPEQKVIVVAPNAFFLRAQVETKIKIQKGEDGQVGLYALKQPDIKIQLGKNRDVNESIDFMDQRSLIQKIKEAIIKILDWLFHRQLTLNNIPDKHQDDDTELKNYSQQ